MEKDFIIIKNVLFDYDEVKSTIPLIKVLGTFGFTVLSHLTWLGYGKKRFDYCPAMFMYRMTVSRAEILTKALHDLQELELVKCDKDLGKIVKNDFVTLDIASYFEMEGGFEKIPSSIFLQNIQGIKDQGWAVYCFLSKFHNNNLVFDELAGWADLSLDFIGNVLGMHRKTASKYINLLEQCGLVESVPAKTMCIGYADMEHKNVVMSFDSKKYRVLHKT